MQFYVPTIGDKIYLQEDWTFTLNQETRNEGLAKRLAEGQTIQHESMYYLYRCKQLYERKEGGWSSLYRPGEEFSVPVPGDVDKWMKTSEAFEFVRKVPFRWKSFKWNNSQAQVTLPRGTELTVDRIYIKKGASAYDSITWRITECKSNKKLKKARFWTTLRDANRIVCDLYPINDTEAPVTKSRFERMNE